jgi:AcrR family transcriptional regulator
VRVVVSDHFVRYVIARWREDLRSPAERQAFIHHSFRETYGPAVEGWTLREDHGSHGRASLACAIDSALLEALRGIFRLARMRVASVQPLFMAAFNRHRRAMGADGAFFVYESGRLCGACFGGEEWLSISNVRVVGPDALAAAIDRELVLHGLPAEAPVHLCIADGSAPPEGLARPVKVVVERSFNGAESPALGEERVA